MKPVLKRDENSAPTVSSRSILTRWNLLVLLLVINGDNGASKREDRRNLRPNSHKKRYKNPKIVVFGDSTSDSGRRFKAPASFDFGGIGAYPWETMYSANDTEEKFGAYFPSPGADTNGKVWPEWLRIPEELNFATSSASMTSTYRSKDICTGYTGQGEQLPTGTFMEQIESYLNYIADSNSNETLAYTHIIGLGANDIEEFFAAVRRYQIGQSLQDQGMLGDGVYEDPVAFDRIFEIVDGSPRLNVEPLITMAHQTKTFTITTILESTPANKEIITELSAGVQKLLSYGVTGRIVIANIPSFRPFPDLVLSSIADIIDEVAVETSLLIKDFIRTSPQLRQLDVYTLLAAVVDNPQIFEDLGFYNAKDAPDENPVPLAVPCLQFDFISDSVSEVMGIQTLRAPGCRRECALCADGVSPCQNCFLGNPSATVCDDPGSRIFWDSRHPTTGFHQLLGEAISQCTEDQPDYDQTLVQILCPDV